MKTETHLNFVRQALHPLQAWRTRSSLDEPSQSVVQDDSKPDPKLANQVLISLMFPSMMMVLAFSMARVALPIIRDDFRIQADMTAWVTTIFTLPFMMLMPVYGRLSDGLGKRRLILFGIVIFTIGTAITLMSTSLAWLMAGRAIQGIGASGLMPLGMAIISSIFPAKDRGKALGSWSTVGPTVGFISPLIAGFLIDSWGWRAAYAPPLLLGVIAFVVVWKKVPAGLTERKPNFLRTFDWAGTALLTGAMTSLLFFLSSRPITGVAPLRDWRLLATTLLLMATFLWWESRRQNPFVNLGIFRNKMFSLASACGGTRMFAMSGISFLVPLYLVDVHGLSVAYIGGLLMVSPGTMAVMTRIGGQFSDRWGSRWMAVSGIGIQASSLAIFATLSETTPLWAVALTLGYYGAGAGLLLAPLHRAALGSMSEAQLGSAAGLYSMIRFAGSVVGTALAGVILQNFLDLGWPVIEAYQAGFWFFAALATFGIISGFFLKEPKPAAVGRQAAQA